MRWHPWDFPQVRKIKILQNKPSKYFGFNKSLAIVRWFGIHRLQLRREVAQERHLVAELQSLNLFALLPDIKDDFDDIVNVALGIDTAWDSETNQVHLRGRPKQRDAGNTIGRNFAQQSTPLRTSSIPRRVFRFITQSDYA